MSAVSYRPDIQGLRAIAVLAVMAFHFNPAWLPGGFIGVDIFLVLSGFLITSILLKKKSKPDYALSSTLLYFYSSRLKRIIPAYFVMLVVVALLSAVLFLPQDFSVFKKGLEKAAWFNSNNYFAGFGDYFAPAVYEQPLLHTWSLAVEIQFYLLAPVLVLLLPVKTLKWVLWALVFGLMLVAEYRLRVLSVQQATYYSLYARLPEFFAGSLAALYVSTIPKKYKGAPWVSFLGFGLIILAAVSQPALGDFPGLSVLLPVVGTVLLLCSNAQGFIYRLLCNRTLVWLGALSYSLYLWHWPVLAFLRYYSGAEVLNLPLSLLFVLLALTLSIASYTCVEIPLRENETVKKQALGWALLLVVTLGTSQGMAQVNEMLTPEKLPIEYRRGVDPDVSCHGKIVDDCMRGDLASVREILVLGDSHANQLNLFFDQLGEELGFRARVITGSSCVTIPGFDYQRISEWAQEACIEQIKVGQRYLADVQMVFVVGSWSYHAKSILFIQALEGFIRQMNDKNKRVVLLSQVPRFTQSAQRIQRFNTLGLAPRIEKDPAYQVANERLANMVTRYPNARFLSLDDLPAFSEAPFFQGKLIYRDEHHINEIGARAYAKDAVPHFLALFAE